MSDYTKTKNYDLYLPVPNADNDVWGDHLNANTTTLDGLIKSVSDKSGVVTFNTRAGAVTLTTTDVTTVLPPGSSPPTMDGTASSGTATAWSRQDHVHPTDTTRAPLNSPIFTGVPVMPTGTQAVTQTAGTSNQTLATTAFVTTSLGAVPGGAVIAPTAPALNPGGLWWDSTGGQLYVRYDDGTSVAYVAATNVQGLANAATKAEVGAALNNSGRNLLHNGLFNVAQRGTGPFTASNTWQYGLDRWRLLKGNAAETFTQVQASLADGDRAVIGDEEARVCLNNAFTGSAVAGSYCLTEQPIERVHRLAGKTVILSFYAKASAALKLGASWDQFFGVSGSPSTIVSSAVQSVNLTTSWARYSLSFVLPSVTGKTLGTDGTDATFLNFWLSSALAGGIGAQSGQIWIWGVQLEIAAAGQTQPSPLDKPDPREDLANCQRFYQVMPTIMDITAYAPGPGFYIFQQVFFPTMRTAPTVVPTYGTMINVSPNGLQNQSTNRFEFYGASTAAGTMGMPVNLITLSADL